MKRGVEGRERGRSEKKKIPIGRGLNEAERGAPHLQ